MVAPLDTMMIVEVEVAVEEEVEEVVGHQVDELLGKEEGPLEETVEGEHLGAALVMLLPSMTNRRSRSRRKTEDV